MVLLKCYQINIHSIINEYTQKKFNNLILNKNIDIILIQEWNAINKYNIHINDDLSNKPNYIKKFPFKLNAKYKIHYQCSETAIIYKKSLNISNINFDYYKN